MAQRRGIRDAVSDKPSINFYDSFELAESLPKSATGKIQWRVLQEQEQQAERERGGR